MAIPLLGELLSRRGGWDEGFIPGCQMENHLTPRGKMVAHTCLTPPPSPLFQPRTLKTYDDDTTTTSWLTPTTHYSPREINNIGSTAFVFSLDERAPIRVRQTDLILKAPPITTHNQTGTWEPDNVIGGALSTRSVCLTLMGARSSTPQKYGGWTPCYYYLPWYKCYAYDTFGAIWTLFWPGRGQGVKRGYVH